MTWQPIETAPEDTYVLVWCPDYFGSECGIARLQSWDNYWMAFEGYLPLATPTHWMPLPNPPEE